MLLALSISIGESHYFYKSNLCCCRRCIDCIRVLAYPCDVTEYEASFNGRSFFIFQGVDTDPRISLFISGPLLDLQIHGTEVCTHVANGSIFGCNIFNQENRTQHMQSASPHHTTNFNTLSITQGRYLTACPRAVLGLDTVGWDKFREAQRLRVLP